MRKPTLQPEELISSRILVIRNQKILLDSDLATLYGVSTKVLNQAVKRNLERFPADFMFQLKIKEYRSLRSQSVTSNERGGRRTLPYAFTEQGVAMLSSVLNSTKAIAVNIQIMRVFVKMRQMVSTYKALLRKIEKLETSDLVQNQQIENIYNVIKELLEPAVKNPRPIGFKTSRDKEIVTNTMTNKQRSKDKIAKVKDLSKHPFFVKRSKEAIAFLKKNGTPSTVKK